MLCQKCHKNLATLRYAEVVDGQVTEQHLCVDCMGRLQSESGAGFELSPTAPDSKKPSAEHIVREVVRSQRACPNCGALLSGALELGKVGCPTCFDTFRDQLSPALHASHQATKHKGKVLSHDNTRAQLQADLQAKRGLLRSVLRAENYEEAARLRDEIRELENGLMSTVVTGAD